MQRLRIRIVPRSAFGSVLMSDTLWGQVCLAAGELWGQDRLEDLLKDLPGTMPFAVFSDGFAEGMLPLPRLSPYPYHETGLSYEQVKKIKKREYVDEKLLLEHRCTINSAALIGALGASDTGTESKPPKMRGRQRVAIDRHSGTAAAGALFSNPEMFYAGKLDIYALLDEGAFSLEDLEQVIRHVGETGYGRDSSTGLGQFEVESIMTDPPALAPVPDADLFMSLSHGAAGDGASLAFGGTLTKFGRHGGEYATAGNPFKNPVVFYRPGSTFCIHEQREVYGTCFDNVSANPGRHLQAAWLLPFFMRGKVS